MRKQNLLFLKQKLDKFKIFLQQSSLRQQLIFAFCFSLVSLLFFSTNTKSQAVKKHKVLNANINTFIPEGFVLIPVQLFNKESLNGLIGKWGWVSLYSSLASHNKTAIVSSIRIIRSPKNPDQFAVLSPENKSSLILSHTEPLIAVIQSSKIKNKNTRFNTKKTIKKNKILIEN